MLLDLITIGVIKELNKLRINLPVKIIETSY